MPSPVFKNQVYSGILEILNDPRLYRYSKLGSDYCRLTEEGEQELKEFINLVGPRMVKLQEKDLEKLAKALVIGELSK